MDPLRLCLALGPAAIYLLLLGAINLSRRPLLVSGTRDAAALGLAISGFALVGPLELLIPEAALLYWGAGTWLLMTGLYVCVLMLVLLLLRPRLVIYNITSDQLRAVLADVIEQLDGSARWAGDSLWLPNLGVQLHVCGFGAFRNVSLIALGPNQNYLGWRRLEQALDAALARVEVSRNPRAIGLITAGLLLISALVIVIARDPQTVAQSLLELINSAARSFPGGAR
jgi:hypothetical protein